MVAAGATAAALIAVSSPVALAADTLPWTGERAPGANQPYQHAYNPDQILDWDPASDPHAEMLRARIPLQERAGADPQQQQHPQLSPETQMLTLAGDYGNAFFESHDATDVFSQHVFEYWQYTDVYAPWHGMAGLGAPPERYDPDAEWTQRWFEFGAVNLPNPAYTDAAHRNGVKSLGAVFFSDNDRGSQSYDELLVRDADGGFPAATKLAEIADYYGFDGYFINQEQVSVSMSREQMTEYREFLVELRELGMYIQWYDSVTDEGEIDYQNQFNALNSPWVTNDEQGRVSDSIFLNYWWDHEMLTDSAAHAREVGVDPRRTVFTGVEAGMYQFDQPYDLQDVLGDDGVPMTAIATLGADFTHSDFEFKTDPDQQAETFDRARQWWTGTSTGTGQPGEDGWQGMSSYITERTAITGSTFATQFNTGHGLETRRDGQIVSDTEWGNIGIQDQPVTWQWWLEGEGAGGLQVDYDYGPGYVPSERFDYTPVGAYDGGSSLVIDGTLDGEALLRLFRTELDVTAGSTVDLTHTLPQGDEVPLALAVTTQAAPGTVVEIPFPTDAAAADGWVTSSIELGDLAGETITSLGIVLDAGDEPQDLQVNLGGLSVRDGSDLTPDAPTGFTIDHALTATDELYLSWDLDSFEDVSQYEVYADGAYLGAAFDDVLYTKRPTGESATLELVAVGHDGSRSEPATIDLDLTGGAGSVDVETSSEGSVTVSWERPVDAGTVTLTERYAAGEPFTTSVEISSGDTSAVFEDVPLDGSELVATVTGGGDTPATATGAFPDRELPAYPKEFATLNDKQLDLRRPALDDWETLTVLEDGEPLLFGTTYSQGEREQMMRGRTLRTDLSQTLAREDSEVVAILRDYAGNEATTVLRAGDDGTPADPAPTDPAPTDPAATDPGPSDAPSPSEPGTPGTTDTAPASSGEEAGTAAPTSTESAEGDRADDALARTGATVWPLAMVAGLLVLVGGAVTVLRLRLR